MTRSILIVNGSQSRRRSSRELLERAGYDVREIVTMDRAIGVARRKQPLAVLVEAPDDIEIPIRFAIRLRRHPLTRDVPVLVLSPDAEGLATMDQVPGVSWLPEPCPPRTLLDELAYLTRPARPAHPPCGARPSRCAR